MAAYAKKLSQAQRSALEEYEAISGFEALGQDALDAGLITFEELCRRNVEWLEDMTNEATRALSLDT